jgi:peptidoglycan/xylan/chitin deacetylase (PgdA/CDA1 family)
MLAAICGAAGLAFSPCGGPARAEHFSNGCEQGRRIALTFDDGPNPPWTGRILDILAQHDARATFFLEGEAVSAHPEIARGEPYAGMAVGAHSLSHRQDLPSLGAADFRDDLDHTSDALSAALGFVPGIYRAPYGHSSDTMLEVEHERGYASIGWDVDSTDWKDSTPDEIVSAALDGAHPGAIVLMHDGGLGGGDPDRSRTAEALPRIIDGLRERGYTLVTVPELTGAPAHHGEPERAACSAS